MDSREEVKAEQRRGGLLSRLRPGRARPALAHRAAAEEGPQLQPQGRPRRRSSGRTPFAEASHEGQKRMSGEDFIEHPLAVATILADLHLDTTTLEAALLHDTVEDTDVTVER